MGIHNLCNNGSLYYYQDYNMNLHFKILSSQIIKSVTEEYGWEGVLKVSISKDYKLIKKSSFFQTYTHIGILPTTTQ